MGSERRSHPPGVLHAQLHPAAQAEDGSLRAITGLLVLADDAPAELEPQVTLAGRPLDVAWGQPSPRAAGRFDTVSGAARAGFVATALGGSGPVELSVRNPATGEREVLVSRRVRRPGGAARRSLEAVRDRLAQEAARPADERDPAAYDELRALLDRVRPAARQGRWQRLDLEVDGVFRQRPRRAFKHMRELSEAHLAEGAGPDFDAWFEGYRRLIHPRTLGYFGYWTALDSRDDAWVWDSVGQVTRAVAGIGHEAFVVSGTLLGLTREGGLVPHDSDVDLAVLLHAGSLEELAVEWAQLRGRLERAGVLDTAYVNTRKRLYKLRLPNGFGCDLFPAWEIDGRASIWPHTHEVDPASVLPLATREIRGVEVRVPRVPEDVLTCNYGPGWRTPDPLFKFDWAGAKERFATFVAATEPEREPEPAPVPAGSSPRLWVHCGAFKTGSTRIQDLVHHQRDALLAQGWLYPAAGLLTDDSEVGHRHSRLVYDHRYDPEAWRGHVADLVAEIRASDASDVLLSSEAWSKDYAPAMLGEVVDALREAGVVGEVRGVLYVRNRTAYARSLYREYVRRRSLRRSFSSFVSVHEAWLDPLAVARDLRTALRGGTLVVRAYDGTGDVAEDFAGVLGLPLVVDAGAPRSNVGLGAVEVEALRQLNRIAPQRTSGFPGLAAVAGDHLAATDGYAERLTEGQLESSAEWQREFAELSGWSQQQVSALVGPDASAGPDVLELGPVLRGAGEAWLARSSGTELVPATYPHPRVRVLELLLADLDVDQFRLRGFLLPVAGRAEGDRLLLVDRLGEHAVEHGLASPGFARRHPDDADATHARFVSAPTGLAPGERVDLVRVAASGERAVLATLRLSLA